MIELFVEFIGYNSDVLSDLPYWLNFAVCISSSFIALWVVCAFLNLFISSVFNIFSGGIR